MTPRDFTPEAEHYAASAPIDLVDGQLLIRSMHRSRKGILLPSSYKAMCCQCGEIVQHRLDKGEALPCRNGHLVATTIARPALVGHLARYSVFLWFVLQHGRDRWVCSAAPPMDWRALDLWRRCRRLPFHTKGVGCRFQACAVCSNQTPISAGL